MEYRGPAPPHPLLQHPPSHAAMFFYPGVPPGTKPPPGAHLLPTVTSQGKHHRSGVPPLPGGHTVPGPGPGVGVGVPPTQPPSGSRQSFAAALRNLAKQAVPPAERENEGEPTQAPRQVSPKRGPPPLVRGASPPPTAGQDSRKERSNAVHEQAVTRVGSSRPADEGPLYTGNSGRSSGGTSVPAPGGEITRGFQPYRPEESRLGAPHPPAPAPPPPPPFGLDPAAAAAYSPYHHGLYPPHLHHAYGLEGQIFDRLGMLRPPMFPSMPPTYPLYLRYPEMIPAPLGLIPPHINDRIQMEEEQHRARENQRLRDEKEREQEREREREREKERREKSRRSPRASPSHHQDPPGEGDRAA